MDMLTCLFLILLGHAQSYMYLLTICYSEKLEIIMYIRLALNQIANHLLIYGLAF